MEKEVGSLTLQKEVEALRLQKEAKERKRN
jgi:hypothetical protein